MKLITTLTSQENSTYRYYANVWRDDNDLLGKSSYCLFIDMDNDVDGTPHWDKDPSGNPDTWLHYQGKPINGDIVRGVVMSPELILLVPDVVMGCLCIAEYEGIIKDAVAFDVGPHKKLGEGTPALLKALGLPASENGNGGLDEQGIFLRFWPGVAAKIDGVQFELQPYIRKG